MTFPLKNKESIALVKLDGTLVRTDGTVEKTNYFKFLELNPEDYQDISFTPDEAQKIKHQMEHMSTGSTAAIPIYCGGAACCPFTQSCPYIKVDQQRQREYQAMKKAVTENGGEFEGIHLLDLEAPKPTTPVGRRCPVESNLMNEWTRLYIEEYEVNPRNFTEFQMVRELAEVELLLWRLNNNLAKSENAQLTQEQVVGIDKHGEAISRIEISSIFEAKERLANRKSKLIKLMVGDRQEKYKKEAATKSMTEADPSVSAAKLRGKIDKLLSQAVALDQKIKDSSDTIIDVTPVDRRLENDTLSPEDLISGGK